MEVLYSTSDTSIRWEVTVSQKGSLGARMLLVLKNWRTEWRVSTERLVLAVGTDTRGLDGQPKRVNVISRT